MENPEPMISEQALQVPYTYSAGPVVSRFLIALRDEKKILGLKCSSCGKVFVPPRALCSDCSKKMEEWVEVGPEGEVVNFTVIHYSEPCHPAPAPFIIALVKLAGADTALPHLLLCGPEAAKIGMKVRAVFREERAGHILDLSGFVPV